MRTIRLNPFQHPDQPRPAPEAAPCVLHVFPTFAVGGAQLRFAALANHFGTRFRHVVLSLDGDLACQARLSPVLDVVFPVVDAPKKAMLTNALRFHRVLRRMRPDVMITCNWGAIEFALANLVPVTRHIHVVDGFGPEEQARQIPRRILTRRLALAGGTVVLPSRTLTRIARESWRLHPDRLQFIPNGIDLGCFDRVVPRGGPDLTVGTVAILRPEKNLGRLLRAFASLASAHPVRLVIVGDGPERGRLTTLARELGVADRIEFAGHRDDVAAMYRRFDVFALSSDTEQMPLSVIEAMASGLPVVSTDVGDIRAMVAEPNTRFIAGHDAASLSANLARLLSDRQLRQELGAANREKARRDFDRQAMFDSWGALWRGASLPA